jgi:hypothetical protein
MIKKGFDIFTTGGSILEKAYGKAFIRCCDICTTIHLYIGCLFCRYRNATMKDWDDERYERRCKKK